MKPRISDRKIFREATSLPSLNDAWSRVRANAGAAGGDGMTVERFAIRAESRLEDLSQELRTGTYLPSSSREVDIPKPSGGLRRLTIPSVIDRIAQTAVAQVLGPPLDDEFEDSSFGYRPGRSVKGAVGRISALKGTGATWIVDADIKNFFDSVPHDRLLVRLGESMTQGPLTDLISLWLEHSGDRGRGLAQGNPLSPLLANLYLDRVDEAFSGSGARIVRYADDFVILCRSEERADKALAKAKLLLKEHGLELNEEKTQVVSFERGFRFLGHLFVRGVVLASPRDDDDDRADSLLKLIRDADSRNEEKEKRREKELSAGYRNRRRILYLATPSRRLAVRNRSFSVEEFEEGTTDPNPWRELLALPHNMVDRIEIRRGVEFTAEANLLGLETGKLITHVDGYGQTLGWSAPALSGRPTRQLAQARTVLDPELRLALAKILIDGKLRNQRAFLRRLNYKRKNAEISKALIQINRIIRQVPASSDHSELMGREGYAAALYWRSFALALPKGVPFKQRRRAKECRDMVNALLNLAASLLARDVAVAIWRVGLNPGFGILHSTNDQRDAAVFDLIEEFRAPLGESPVAYAFNNRIVRFSESDSEPARLSREDVAAFIRIYEKAVSRVVKYPRTGRRYSWRDIIGEQAYLLAAHMEGDDVYKPVVMDY